VRLVSFFFLCVFCVALAACTGKKQAASKADTSPSGSAAAKPVITVSILPQEWFVQQIAGDKVEVSVLVGQGQDVHDYEPTPRQIAELAKASAWLLSGAEFEIPFKPKVEAMFPGLSIVDATAGVTWRHFRENEAVPNDTDQDEKAGNIDRHSWLGLQGAELTATHVRDMLSKLDPANTAFYSANCDKTLVSIKGTFAGLARELAPLRGSTVFVYHPAFGYFLDQFGIVQRAVETGGKEPTPRELSALVTQARKLKPRAIFVQAQFPATTAQTLARSVGAKVLPLDPLAEDWLANVKSMAQALTQAY
jgi:zinc transport system substrate-binding protein